MDEKDRIIMEVVNADKVRELTKDLDKQTASLESLAKQLRDTTLTQGMFDAAAKPFAEKAASLRKEIKALEAETKSYGQAALTAAHATQDFVQGGIGGVLNNIPMLVQQLGGPAGLTAIISGVGIAAYVATPHIKAWMKSLAGSEAVGGLVGLSKALEAIKSDVDKIKEADIWNLETIQRYNEKLVDQAQIEKDIAERKQHKNDYEAFMASQTPEDKARSEELRKGFAEVFAGQGKELQAELIKGMDAQAEFARDQLRKEMAGIEVLMKQAASRGDNATARKYGDRIKAIDKQIADIGNDINRRAIDMIAEASAGTDRTKQKRAIDQMRGLVGDATRVGLDMVVERDWVDRPDVETDAERASRVAGERQAEQKRRDDAQRKRDAIMAPLEAAASRQEIDAELQAQERALNGGFTGAESQQIASGNMALAEAGRGQASEDQLQKIISQNQAMMDSLSLSGGDGSAAMSAFMELQTQLLWTLGQLREVRMQQQQWRQMQQTSGTLLSRGRG